MTAEEDAKRTERMKQINERFGKSVIRDGKRVFVPEGVEVQATESKRFRGELPKDE